MATDIASLVDRAMDARRRLEERGLSDEARIMEQLVRQVIADQPAAGRPFYTTGEAATLVGVTAQTIKNWVRRGILKGYRLGARIVIPSAELDDYRPMADALRAIEPLPGREEIVEMIRAGRRPVTWPKPGEVPGEEPNT